MVYRIDYKYSSNKPNNFAAPRRPHTNIYYTGRTHGRIIPRVAHGRVASVPPPSRFSQSQDIYSLYDTNSSHHYSTLPYRTKVVLIQDTSTGRELPEFNSYEEEARDIRRDANSVLRHIALGLPAPLYSSRNIPLRSSSEVREIADVRRRYVNDRNNLGPMSRIQSEIYRMAMYQEPMRKSAGRGNLACISYAGGRPISRRQVHFFPEDSFVRDEINFKSFYNSLRVAASLGTLYKKPVYQPLYKSKKSLLALTGATEEKPKKQSKWESRAMSEDVPPSPKLTKSVSRDVSDSFVIPTPRKSIVDMPERKKSVEEEPEAKIVLKMARMPSRDESQPEIIPEVLETVKIAPKKIEEIVEKEPSPEPEIEAEIINEPEPEPEPEILKEPEIEPEIIAEPEVEEEIIAEPEVKEEIFESEPEIIQDTSEKIVENEISPVENEPESVPEAQNEEIAAENLENEKLEDEIEAVEAPEYFEDEAQQEEKNDVENNVETIDKDEEINEEYGGEEQNVGEENIEIDDASIRSPLEQNNEEKEDISEAKSLENNTEQDEAVAEEAQDIIKDEEISNYDEEERSLSLKKDENEDEEVEVDEPNSPTSPLPPTQNNEEADERKTESEEEEEEEEEE